MSRKQIERQLIRLMAIGNQVKDNIDKSVDGATMSQVSLSARANHRILKLARTIADLAGCEDI